MNVDVAQVGLQSYRFELKFVADIGGPLGEALLQSRNSFECSKMHLFQVNLTEALLITENKHKLCTNQLNYKIHRFFLQRKLIHFPHWKTLHDKTN
jgi:hypothetical protein